MLVTTEGHDSLRMPMHSAVVNATIIGGELWIALSEADIVECGVKKGEIVGVASWYPPGTDFLAEYVTTYTFSPISNSFFIHKSLQR